MLLSPFHALYTARELSDYAYNSERLTAAYASSDIEVYPYQVAAAMFALRSPYLKGVVLADEGSLGKTYEALLVISQMWYEGKERILLVVPTPLLHQWRGIIQDCFSVPFQIYTAGENNFDFQGVTLTTYEVAVQNANLASGIAWDVVVFEEAHRLSKPENKTTIILKEIVGGAYKVLLTATPMQNSIMDLYGLIDFIDEGVLGDSEEFYKRYFRKPENYHELTARVSRYVFRTLRSQVERYVKIPQRLPVTADYQLSPRESRLAEMVNIYLKKSDKQAFPKMDNYDLTLMFNRALASSPFALAKLLDSAISRVKEPELVEMAELAATIEPKSTVKGKQLLEALKIAFKELKKHGANRKVIIFTESLATLGFLHELLSGTYKTLAFNGSKSSEYSIIKNFEDEAEILITTDVAAEGFNLAFCSLIINYDLPYNVLTLEQRIMRCHRFGQDNDVVVLNFISRSNLADTRILELINKRVLQFDGIVGMSDDVVGNFSDNAADGITKAFASSRHKDEIEKDFQSTLVKYEEANIDAVSKAENMLFTSFTRDIASKITITPQYIKDRTAEINDKLWALTKWFFRDKQGYECIDETRTVRIGLRPQKVFTGARLGRTVYSMDDKTLPKSGHHTICGTLAKNIINEIFWRGIPDSGSITVQDLGSPCRIGYYRVKVKPEDSFMGGIYYNTFVGKTVGNSTLTDKECRNIMGLPVLGHTSGTETYGERDGITKTKPPHDLDDLVNTNEFIRRAIKDTDDARKEEIERIQDRAYHQKQALNRDISVLKNQLMQIENSLSRSSAVTDKIDAEKKKASTNKELKKREQSLFLDSIRIETEADTAIKSLAEQIKLTADVSRQFEIQAIGKGAKDE